MTEEASPKLQARVFSFGELLSTSLGLAILHQFNLQMAVRMDARTLLHSTTRGKIVSDVDVYLNAHVDPSSLQDSFRPETNLRVVITQGFLASTATGETCVLGRGGSDTSATLFGVLLTAARVEIWTDVHGLFTSDPRRIPTARLIRQVYYRHAQELAAMGAKVLHPRCIGPAAFANIPIQIRNTDDPTGELTSIEKEPDSDSPSSSKKPAIMAVVRRTGMTLLTVTAYDMCGASGFLSSVFAPFGKYNISVDLIATSQVQDF